MELEVRQITPTDWTTLIFVSCFVLYTIARQLYPRRFDQFILLPFTNKFFLVQGKEDTLRHPFYVVLFVAQVAAISLFVFYLLNNLSTSGASYDWITYVQIVSFYTAFVLIKIYIERIVGAAFRIDKLIGRYLFKKHSYRNLLGILVFAISLPLVYLETPTTKTLVFIVLLVLTVHISSFIYMFRPYFGLIIPNFFYFILYLCALEIAPYIILYTALENGGQP